MPRLFTAIALPDDVRDVLSSMGGGVGHARWLDYDQLHMTLVFLGGVADAKVGQLIDRLDRIPWQPFDLRVRDLGVFPTRGRPRVIWAGVSSEDALLRLVAKNHDVASDIGLTVQRRKYHPHVTLARLNHPRTEEVAVYLRDNSALSLPAFTVDAFELWQSHLAPEGASYSVVHRFEAER